MSARVSDPDDPKGLIRESYRIDGITDGECRSILIDWALSLPAGSDQPSAALRLLERYAETGHPMTELLRAASVAAPASGRKGGRASRIAKADAGRSTDLN